MSVMREEDRVDLPVGDGVAQLVERHGAEGIPAGPLGATRPRLTVDRAAPIGSPLDRTNGVHARHRRRSPGLPADRGAGRRRDRRAARSARRPPAARARPRADARRQPDDRAPGVRRARARAGLVERGVGRGTFVAAPRVELDRTARVAGFTEQMERAGPRAGRDGARAPRSCARRARSRARCELDAGRAGRADPARALGRRPAADARGLLAARRALPGHHRARTSAARSTR